MGPGINGARAILTEVTTYGRLRRPEIPCSRARKRPGRPRVIGWCARTDVAQRHFPPLEAIRERTLPNDSSPGVSGVSRDFEFRRRVRVEQQIIRVGDD